MKKLIYFSVLFLVFGLKAKLDLERPEAYPSHDLSLLKNLIRTFDDFMYSEHLGYQSLTKKNGDFIKSIISNLDMDDYCIEIRGMSNLAQRVFGHFNSFVVPSNIFGKKSHSYLYISEDWFDTLSEQEKQALVRHELMHLKKNHAWRKVWFVLLSGISWSFLNIILWNAIMHRNYPYLPEDQLSYIVYDTSSRVFFWGWLLLLMKHSRMCEKEADIEAAKTMQDKQGFIDLLKNMKDYIEDPISKFRIKKVIHNIFNPIEKLFRSHPEFDERIAYINELS